MVTASTVRIVRAYLNWTQSELVKRMGLSGGSVSAVVNGMNRVTSEFAKKFKRAAGITDSVLIDIQYLKTMVTENRSLLLWKSIIKKINKQSNN